MKFRKLHLQNGTDVYVRWDVTEYDSTTKKTKHYSEAEVKALRGQILESVGESFDGRLDMDRTPVNETRHDNKKVSIEERIAIWMKNGRLSYREACVALGQNDPGPETKDTNPAIRERAARWKKFAPAITAQEAMQLATKGIEP